jgi:hypothetical protein
LIGQTEMNYVVRLADGRRKVVAKHLVRLWREGGRTPAEINPTGDESRMMLQLNLSLAQIRKAIRRQNSGT